MRKQSFWGRPKGPWYCDKCGETIRVQGLRAGLVRQPYRICSDCDRTHASERRVFFVQAPGLSPTGDPYCCVCERTLPKERLEDRCLTCVTDHLDATHGLGEWSSSLAWKQFDLRHRWLVLMNGDRIAQQCQACGLTVTIEWPRDDRGELFFPPDFLARFQAKEPAWWFRGAHELSEEEVWLRYVQQGESALRRTIPWTFTYYELNKPPGTIPVRCEAPSGEDRVRRELCVHDWERLTAQRCFCRICGWHFDEETEGHARPDRGNRMTQVKDEYKRYLRSPQWLEKRGEALQRAAKRCQLCGFTEQLEVHHNTYEHLGDERPEDLVVLCSPCHRRHHGRTP